ncbi:nucleotidyltransferase family protein [Terasakiella pusilla]|uniref:nucleotidyltransferase family protein n=1 Tax=Terasakiella pusilla TaxID=64973 RepID=UPI00068F995C|nr:nucleotidyltransferase family protein [Terasakiella pusilla]
MVYYKENLENCFIFEDAPISEAIHKIEANAAKIALVTNQRKQLVGTITDGDIRRSILNNVDDHESVSTLLKNKSHPDYTKPIQATEGSSKAELAALMHKYKIASVPLVNEENQVVDIAIFQDLVEDYKLPVRAVVMAGGLGTRLRPLTDSTPKPMLPVGEKPLLEQIIAQLKTSFINDVVITTHYLANQISDHFGDGHNHGVNIQYVQEDEPLGTAGSIGLIPEMEDTLLIINGDILTNMDFSAFLHFHKQHNASLSVAVRRYTIDVPYGVIESKDSLITSIKEKPQISFFVNAGIYLVEPDAREFIPEGSDKFDMPDLVTTLLDQGKTVVNFPIHEYWLDIGKPDDYLRASQDIAQGVFTPATSN